MSDRLKHDALRARIEAAYESSGNRLGWRFLYSPEAVLEGAEIAFIGLNPGGGVKPLDHALFCMAHGSAYADESWAGHPRGESPLQRQALLLFHHLDVRPEKVLAGNLVPFRSPDWNGLPDKAKALRFGQSLWGEVLGRAHPKLVIGMGQVASGAVAAMLGLTRLTSVPVNWGSISAQKGRVFGGLFVGLPHLSRFGIVSRPQSAAALSELFEGYWRK